MKTKYWIILAVLGIILIPALTLIGYYNSFVTKQQAIDAQWAQVESQYQRRYDLIPNLVNSAKGYMEYEGTVLQDITEARSAWVNAENTEEKVKATNEFESALERLLVVVENYPDLKASQPVQSLMDELAGTENRIAVERMRYNEKVREYNTAIMKFPGNMIANMFGFGAKTYFEAREGAEEAPEVNLTI